MLHLASRSHKLHLRWSLPLLAAVIWTGCNDGHNAAIGQQVTDGTIVATFDPTDIAYRQPVTSLAPRGAPGTGSWRFDIFDADKNRLKGVKTHWVSSDPAVVTLPNPDLTTSATDVMWETELAFTAVGAGDAVLTGTVVGAKTVNDAPVTVTLNVHVTGPGVSIVLDPQFQAGVLNLDPEARKMGSDTVPIFATVLDAAGERVVGATLDWSCAGSAADAEFTNYGGVDHDVIGAGCTDTSNDVTSQEVTIRAYHTGLFGFHAALHGAPEVSADAGVVFVGAGARLELDPPSVALVVGGERDVTGTVVDQDGSRYPAGLLDFVSHDVSVVRAVSGQRIRGIASGDAPGQVRTTTVTAALNDTLTAELGVTVYRSPANVLIAPALTLAPGGQGSVTATLVDTDGVTPIPDAATSLTWSSADVGVATVAATASDDTVTVTGVAAGTTEVRATTAEGVAGVGPVTVQSAPAGCYPECIEALRRACVPSGACTTNATPPPPFSDTFYFCYGDGVRIVSTSTSTGSHHTQYRPDGNVCFTIDTTFAGTNGRNVTEVWRDAAGNLVGTETYDSMAADGGRSHSVTCGGQSFAIDSEAPSCAYPDCSVQDASCM